MSTPGDHMPERDALAAEYVLGTLPLADRQAAEVLISADANFARLVEEWQARLAILDDSYGEEKAPNEMLNRIEARLFPEPSAPKRSWLPNIITVLIGAVAMATAIFLLIIYLPGLNDRGAIIATLTGEGQPLVVAASYAPDSGRLTVTRSAGPAADTENDYELWIIPAGQAAISLGLLRDDALVADLPALPAGTTLAITLEPNGGAPGGVATGPILVAAVIE